MPMARAAAPRRTEAIDLIEEEVTGDAGEFRAAGVGSRNSFLCWLVVVFIRNTPTRSPCNSVLH
jgi:hypothetical protein